MTEQLRKIAASTAAQAALRALLSHQRSPSPVRIATLAHSQPLEAMLPPSPGAPLTASRRRDDAEQGREGKVISAVSGPIYSKPEPTPTHRAAPVEHDLDECSMPAAACSLNE
jgi:hypothetical protein